MPGRGGRLYPANLVGSGQKSNMDSSKTSSWVSNNYRKSFGGGPNLSGPTRSTNSIGSNVATREINGSSSAMGGIGVSATAMARNGDSGRANTSDKTKGVRHLSYNEIMDRRNRGLCFCCGERYSPTHQCAARSLRCLIVGDDEATEGTREDHAMAGMEVENGKEEEGLECQIIGLMGLSSYDAMIGLTMRIEASIHGTPILILIDSGVGHNFVSPQMVSSLDLTIDRSKKLTVRLGDGHRAVTVGKCYNIPLQIGKFDCVVDAYILDIGGVDLILGVTWLSSLGKITTDFKELTMSFVSGESTILLSGLKGSTGQLQKQELHALSLQELEGESMREIGGWLWNTEIAAMT